MPASYPSFATPDQYAKWLGIDPPPPDGTQDLLDAASTMIRRYCGWHVAPVLTEDVVVDGRGGHSQLLPTLRLVDIVTLTETRSSDSVDYPGTDLEFSRDGYVRKPDCGRWTGRLRGITATITHGFEDYGDLATMAMTMVARATANPYSLTNQSVGGVAVGMSTTPGGQAGGVALFDNQLMVLDEYRIFGRP